MKTFKLILHMTAVLIIYLLTFNFSNVAFQLNATYFLGEVMYVFLDIFAVLFSIYLYTSYILKKPLREMYLGGPTPRPGWCITAVLMPLAICLFYLFFTDGTFCRESLAWSEIADAVCLSVLSEGIRAGITEEMLFRGVLFYPLQKEWGMKRALILSNLIFAVIHLEKIDTSDVWNIIFLMVAATIAGSALSLVTYQTGSVWSAVMIHIFYNIFGGDSQIIHIDTEQIYPALWTYTLKSRNRLLTGLPGTDDLETALPAVIGFLTILILAVWLIRKEAGGNMSEKMKNTWK